MDNKELEIKLLNVKKSEFERKLKSLQADYCGEVIQKIYTYDCYDPITMYELIIKDYKITKSKYSLNKLINYLKQIEVILSTEDKSIIKEVLGVSLISKYIENNLNIINIHMLLDKRIKRIIRRTKEKFFKWIRLRQNGDKVELTIKYIYNVNKEYNIDDVKEIEIIVDNFEEANKIIEEMGYYRKKLVEKKRTSYNYNSLSIVIDEWPLIPPYVEIEGNNVSAIYSLAEQLGYKKEDAKIMNTEDVYLDNGIDLTSYEVLTFKESIKAK